MELALLHPLNERKFIKLHKTLQLINGQLTFTFDEEDSESFFPNIILLPLIDYHITVTIYELSNPQEKIKYTKYCCLRKSKMDELVVVHSQEVTLEFKLMTSTEEIDQLIDKMNYKYHYAQFPQVLRLFSVRIELPEEFFESDQEEALIKSSANIVD